MHELERMEDAILAALAPLRELGARTIEVYNGPLGRAEDLARTLPRFPCLLVSAGGLRVQATNRLDLVTAEIGVLVGDRHRRGPGVAAKGDAASPGVWALLLAVRSCLNGRSLLPGWSRLAWQMEEALVEDLKQGLCLWAALYETRTPLGRQSGASGKE